MLKHLYRLVVCIIVFVLSIVYFSHNIHQENNKKIEIQTGSMSEATFPIVEVKTCGYSVNTLHGYTTSLNTTYIRDGIIPMGDDSSFEIAVDECETTVTKGSVQISPQNDDKVIEEVQITSFEDADGLLTAKINLEKEYTAGKEYVATITLVTDRGDKIKYYSIIKKEDVSHLKKIIDYAMEFHENVLDKKTASEVVSHIEPDNSMNNTDLAYVNIHSSLDLISYGKLSPKVVKDADIKLHDVNDDTAIVELEFYVSADTGSGKETYRVNESFRIRYTDTRMYLLGYDRTMESVFDVNLISLSGDEFKLGITRNTNTDYVATSDRSKIAFVRDGQLWYYNSALNSVISVFSFKQDNTDYIRDVYDKHNIRIIRMDDLGNLDFVVYGYMNAGEYEGREGIILYKYYSAEQRIEEQVYIPSDVPYEVLEDRMGDVFYVNGHDVFYFSLDNEIYSYDMITDKLKTLAKVPDNNHMILSVKGEFIAWMDSDDADASINIIKLETEQTSTIDAKEGKSVRLLGALGDYIIYGFAGSDDVSYMTDRSLVMPVSLIEIADVDGEVIKEYVPDGCFVTDATVEGSKVKINQVKKDDSGRYVACGEDYIFNSDSEKEEVKTSYRLTDVTMTEWYMSIPDAVKISKKPQVVKALVTQIDEDDKAVTRTEEESQKECAYYAYSYHGLLLISETAGEAVVAANKNMGLVYDNSGNVIWRRIRTDEGKSADAQVIEDEDSVAAAMKTLIATDGGDYSSFKDNSKLPITQVLNDYMKHEALNLTGASLSETFYYISKGCPVMAMKSPTQAVVITSYSKNKIKYVDSDGTIRLETIKNASEMFEKSGNVFISYAK